MDIEGLCPFWQALKHLIWRLCSLSGLLHYCWPWTRIHSHVKCDAKNRIHTICSRCNYLFAPVSDFRRDVSDPIFNILYVILWFFAYLCNSYCSYIIWCFSHSSGFGLNIISAPFLPAAFIHPILQRPKNLSNKSLMSKDQPLFLD